MWISNDAQNHYLSRLLYIDVFLHDYTCKTREKMIHKVPLYCVSMIEFKGGIYKLVPQQKKILFLEKRHTILV